MAIQRKSTSVPSSERTPKAKASYERIVVKAGSALLTHGTERLNLQVMATLVEQMALLHSQDTQMLLVSSGAVAAGHHVLDVPRAGRDLPFRQVLAAVGQGRLMHVYEQLFGWHRIPVAQALLARRDFNDRLGYLNVRNTLLSLLDLRVIPIINENDVVAVDELADVVFGDNDNLSAMVANLVDADLLVMLGEVEGLFTSDPHLDPEAQLVPVVKQLNEDVEAMGGASWSQRGQGGMATKLEAAKLATSSGVDVVIASGLAPEVLTRLAGGEAVGTLFPATSSKMESRKRWMLSGASTKGGIEVDNGAASALLVHRRSLLPAGVREVLGSFERGDIIAIVSPDGRQIAVGITNYDSREVAVIKGHHSTEIGGLLGHHFGDDVVHRNNMVVV